MLYLQVLCGVFDCKVLYMCAAGCAQHLHCHNVRTAMVCVRQQWYLLITTEVNPELHMCVLHILIIVSCQLQEGFAA